MQKLVSHNLWQEIAELAGNSGSKKAAIAYITTDKPIQFGDGDLLIVDASNPAIASGETSAAVLDRAFKRGAKIYSCPGLHSKVIVLDEIAIIGSANLSQSSMQDLIEAAFVTDQPRIVAMATAFIEQLRRSRGLTRVDDAFIKHIKKIPIVRRGGRHSGRKEITPIQTCESRVWIVTTQDLDDDAFPKEKKWVNKGEKIRNVSIGMRQLFQEFIEVLRPAARAAVG